MSGTESTVVDSAVFEEHLKNIEIRLQQDWLPLPGLGSPADRHARIRATINQAQTRAAEWVGKWSLIQEARHIHSMVEALGALANTISQSVMTATWSNVITDADRGLARAEMEEILSHAADSVKRTELLASGARGSYEAAEIRVTLLSMRVESLSIHSIYCAKDFSTVPGSIDGPARESLQELADPLIRDIDHHWSDFAIQASPCWLKAKVKSVLQVARVTTQFKYLQLAVLAEDDPKTSIEISKLAFSEESTLEACADLLPVLNRCFGVLGRANMWGEDHRRAVASIQPWLHKAVINSARSGEVGRQVAERWLTAHRMWGAGLDLLGDRREPEVLNAHLVAADDRLARICVGAGSSEFSEVMLDDDFWHRVWSIHKRFEKEGVGTITKDERRYLAKALRIPMSLSTQAPSRVILHGRTALIPWFSLSPDGGRLWAFDTTLVAPSIAQCSSRSPKVRQNLAIIDDAFGATASRALQAWSRFTDSESGVIRIDSRKRAFPNRQEIMEKMQNADTFLFFGHGQSEMDDYRQTGLKLAREDWFTPADIAACDLTDVHQVVLIACESGRSNMGVPVSSIGETFVARGASNVISTLWRTQSDIGAGFLETYFKQLKKKGAIQRSWATTIQKDPGKYGYFTLTTR